MKKYNKAGMKKILFIVSPLVFLTSCMSYYMAIENRSMNNPRNIDSLNSLNKYFILQNGSKPMTMSGLRVDIDSNTIICSLTSVRPEHTRYTPGMKRSHTHYNKRNEEKNVLKEVHVFMNYDTLAKMNTLYTFKTNNIKKIEIIEKDKVRSTTSHVIGYTIGGAILAFIIGFAIVVPLLGTF